MIAAIALANGLTLIANNLREFERIPNLICEDWTV
jgi:predicted nucleic acid-binding protein